VKDKPQSGSATGLPFQGERDSERYEVPGYRQEQMKGWSMKKLIAAVALLFVVPALVRAADADNSVHGQYYLFIGPVLSSDQLGNADTTEVGNNTGIGGEVLIYRGVGVGIDLGYAGSWSFGGSGSALGVGSLNATYHFPGNKSSKMVDPFLTVGYSLYYGQRTFTRSGFNLGGGVNIWLSNHVAPRLEIRYQGGINYFGSDFKEYAAFRFGVTFR